MYFLGEERSFGYKTWWETFCKLFSESIEPISESTEFQMNLFCLMEIGSAFSRAKIRCSPIVMGHWLNLSFQVSSRTSNKHFLRQDYEDPSWNGGENPVWTHHPFLAVCTKPLSENHRLAGAERGLLRTYFQGAQWILNCTWGQGKSIVIF